MASPKTSSTSHSTTFAIMPFGIHRTIHDMEHHGCKHLAELKASTQSNAGLGHASNTPNKRNSFLSPESATLSAAAAALFESYASCVRYSLTYRNRFQMHIYKKGREFKYLTAVDDDEIAASKTCPVKSEKHSTMSTAARSTTAAVSDTGIADSLSRPTDGSNVHAATQDTLTPGNAKKRKRNVASVGIDRIVSVADKSNDADVMLLAMDFIHCTVYCRKCNDYVYDLDIERILHAEQARINMIISRIKEPNKCRIFHQPWTPTLTEIQQIQEFSTLQKCAGLRGLRNMGSTCFMNTILQTFIHNPLLRAHFLSDKHDRRFCPRKSQPCLSCEMDDLFCQFYNGKTTPYGPSSFLYAMWMSQKHLAGYQQQDAHEFFISVLNEIHNSCSGQHSHAHSSAHQCQCVIHQVFGGLLQSDVTCQKCGNVTTVWDPILDISLDIKSNTKLSGPKKANLGTKKNSFPDTNEHRSKIAEPYSLLQCLEGFTIPERLGPNQYTCASCANTHQEATKQLSMKHLPPVLAIQLKRFEHTATASTKIDTFVRVPSELDMTPHTTRAVKLRAKLKNSRKDSTTARRVSLRGTAGFDTLTDGNPTYKYSLFAIVNHEGKIDTGHYKAYAKCPRSGRIGKYTDTCASISEITLNMRHPTITDVIEMSQAQRVVERKEIKRPSGAVKVKTPSKPKQKQIIIEEEVEEGEVRMS
ncbi:hypothetical protein BDEG_23788 [Batrachochytrium dendrobatidis JEL423]|uniref:ubiquitinyl hydrolase 1 n=1 Tax=Batrachochytrium dendrobatidis (strain JEL423) TaxID=403673 RepID=A0A177WIR2_BATDL|nr:hypothetical protein BDEG_23788 [Batrachochytrium dendrobatidis JEL423]